MFASDADRRPPCSFDRASPATTNCISQGSSTVVPPKPSMRRSFAFGMVISFALAYHGRLEVRLAQWSINHYTFILVGWNNTVPFQP